jgi:oligopeptide/dipeptide ABC transporter ATP-binding protein
MSNLLDVRDLKKYFPMKKGMLRRVVGHVRAVDGVSFTLAKGETLGLVGESGCGKTTTGRCILRLIEPSGGKVQLTRDGSDIDLATADNKQLKEVRRDIQMIFQDPVSSLDPRMTVRNLVAEPLVVHKIGKHAERTMLVKRALARVRLSDDMVNRYPHEFSGGQRQRIGLARALILDPLLLVCDEPVSALDVSVQAQVLNLLQDLKNDMGLSLLFIAHDLSVVEHISDRVMVMYLGKIVESAASGELYQRPAHPYTEALLASLPRPDPRSKKKRFLLKGSVPDPSDAPSGCYFHTRCQYATEICQEVRPELKEVDSAAQHYAACHRFGELDLQGYDRGGKPNWLQ